MNKKDRKELEKAKALIEQGKEIIAAVKDAEQEKYDNLPEGVQSGEKGQKFEEAVSLLEDAEYTLESVVEQIDEAMN